MNKELKFIIISILVCTGIVSILWAFMPKPLNIKNGFNRTVIEKASLESSFDLKYVNYYFAGATEHRIYLGNSRSALHLISIDGNLGAKVPDTSWYSLRFERPDSGHWDYARLSVDSPFIYLSEGVTPNIFSARMNNFTLNKHLRNVDYFNLNVNLSNSSFIARASTIKGKTVLLKIQADSPYIIRRSNILTKQIDGFFCTDGSLVLDKDKSRLIYLYYYRNEYICMDTNLNVINRNHTVDTNSIAKIEIASINNQSSTFSAPAFLVNKAGAIYQNNLYISSALLADNETKRDIGVNEIIDVYSVDDGRYKYSFYLPKYKGGEINYFTIINDKIIAINSHYLLTYTLPQ